jgi:hypothetical protein
MQLIMQNLAKETKETRILQKKKPLQEKEKVAARYTEPRYVQGHGCRWTC